MNSMNENDDDGYNYNDIPMAAASSSRGANRAVGSTHANGNGGGGGGGTTPTTTSASASAVWNTYGSNHDDNDIDNNFNFIHDGGGPLMDEITQHNDNNPHPMVSFSDTQGGMGMAGGTQYHYNEENNPMMMTIRQQDPWMNVPSLPSSNSTANSNIINSNNNNNNNNNNNTSLNFHPDLPFLVTHWLSTFAPPPPPPSTTLSSSSTRPSSVLFHSNAASTIAFDNKRMEAINVIRQHASSLAHAFQTLGAFGLSSSGCSSGSSAGTGQVIAPYDCRPTTYADMIRKYSHLLHVAIPSTHDSMEERMMNSSSSRSSSSHSSHYFLDGNGNRMGALLGALVCASAREDELRNGNRKRSGTITPWSLLEASYEGLIPLPNADDGAEQERGSSNSAIVPAAPAISNGEKRKVNHGRPASKSSSFGLPGRKVGEITSSSSSIESFNKATNEYIRSSGDIITSSMGGINAHNADASSLYRAASVRAAAASRTHLTLRREMHSQRREMECNRMALQQSTRKQSEFVEQVGGIGDGFSVDDSDSNNPQRIVAHLNNRRVMLQSKYISTTTKLAEAEREAKQSYKESTSIRRQYHDTYKINGQPTALHQMLRDRSGSLNLGYGPSAHAPGKNNLVLPSILSRQYRPRHKMSHVSRTRLSVLKSRFSHAATINCHLIYPVYCLKFDKTGKYFITGADDQVAKVFHLGAGPRKTTTKYGDQFSTPPFNYCANSRGAVLVCCLRGHAGVISDLDVSSDNSLLATASGDGDVRIWGLKDGWPVATLRGHEGGVNWVSWSLLSPYRVVTCGDDGYAKMWDVRGAAEQRLRNMQTNTQTLQQDYVQLPVHHDNNGIPGDPFGMGASANIGGIELQSTYGEFVFNDHIDGGVTLMASLQHFSTINENNEVSVRSTRTGTGKQIRVLCISRCPSGDHFATGSDDGVGRVWIDDDDWLVERQDSDFDPDDDVTIQCSKQRTMAPRVPPRERLLAVLRGHNKPITEIKYSSAGDRLLTASEDDGNICIWSGFPADPSPSRFLNMSKLCIELNIPSYGGHGSKVRCDGVAWSCDDLKVVSSQSIPASATGNAILPDSHVLCVWDSYSGKCLMRIPDSHTSISIALASHPYLPSVVALAGFDGSVNVWDLDRGDCFFTHINTLLHGPVEPITERGKRRGCIELQFSPDGLNLVVTDDSGRVIILDTQVPAWVRTGTDSSGKAELSEQYFANDYYELVYDKNGNCIEKGSQQPPHLAPGGARCSHEGVPLSESTRDLFLQLEGPLPLPCKSALWSRNEVRFRGSQSRFEGGMSRKYSSSQMKRVSAGRCESTVVLTMDGTLIQHENGNSSLKQTSSTAGYRNHKKIRSANTSLSSRYHWVDYNDLPDSEDDREDQLDNDYHGLDESSEDDVSSPYRQGGQSLGGRRRSRRSQREASDDDSHVHRRPARSSSRRTTQLIYHELSSDDDHLQEMMSAHTKPSGKYVNDWEVSGHMFKLPRGGGSIVHRSWLHRTSYQERKCYCPQVGDLVVYVPKAHDDTLRRFPINDYTPPWKSWPTATSWPVVLCKVTHARYRFPFATNYKSRHQGEKLMGVSAILTLEIVGVPSQTRGRSLPWPAPTFISPTDKRTRFGSMKEFDVTLFVSDEDDFLIPEHIYSWRLKELERAIRNNGGDVDGLHVTVYCPPDSGSNGQSAEDTDYACYAGRLVKIIESSENEFHFSDSGHAALSLEWDAQDHEKKYDLAVFSVWSISVACPSCDAPVAPTMGEEVTNAVRDALRSIIGMDPNVKEWFFEQIDTSKFTDYLDMVEVPIHLSLIQMRLRSNYYTNKLSVIADMEQLMENCYKYNGDDNDFYDLAREMYERFKTLVEAIEEPPALDIELASAELIKDQAAGKDESPFSLPDARAQNISSVDGLRNDVPEQPQRAQSTSNGSDMTLGINRRRPVRGSSLSTEDVQRSGTRQSSGRRSILRSRSREGEKKSENDLNYEESSADEIAGSDEEDTHWMKNYRNTRASSTRANSKVVLSDEASEKKVGSRRRCSRTKSIPMDSDKSSEEEDYSEDSARSEDESEGGEGSEGDGDSGGDVPAVRRNTRRPSARTSMPSRARQEPKKTTMTVRQQSSETRTLRISLRAKSKPLYAEQDSDEDEDNGSHDSGGSNRKVSDSEKLRSNLRIMPTRTSSISIKNSSQRKSLRGRPKTDSLENVGAASSEEESDGEISNAKENTRNGRPSRRTRSRSSYFEIDSDTITQDSKVSCSRTSPRAKSRKVYADIDSYSESKSEDEQSEDDSSSEEEPNRSTRKRGLSQSNASDKKRARTQRKSPIVQKYPDLEKWGPITKRKIFSIGTAVLSKLRELDTLDLFSLPVLETHPSLAAAYKKKVKSPMDFQTIEKERLPFYTHIADLQDDLILTFRNCCEFNGEMTEFYNYALVIWGMLNDVYNAVLEVKY